MGDEDDEEYEMTEGEVDGLRTSTLSRGVQSAKPSAKPKPQLTKTFF